MSISNLPPFNPADEGYVVTITDANGCSITGGNSTLRAPEREDWSMQGNAGTNPTTLFMGTTDNKDFIFKTNNSERMRMTGSGSVVIPGLGFGNGNTNSKFVLTTSNGTLTSDISFDGQGLINFIASCSQPQLKVFPFPWLQNSSFSNKLTNCFHSFGFGILNPLEKIHVAGQARFSAPLGAMPTNYLNIGWDNGLMINAYGSDLLINNNTASKVKINTGGTQGDFEVGGNSILASVSGKVGIGTSAPKELLSIGNEFVFSDGGSKVLARNFYNNGNDLRVISGYSSSIYFSSNGDLRLSTAASGAANSAIIWNPGININNAGHIGLNSVPDINVAVKISGTTSIFDVTTPNLLSISFAANNTLLGNPGGDIHLACAGNIQINSPLKLLNFQPGILLVDANGIVSNLPTNNTNQVLLSNGTWGAVPGINNGNYWSLSGANLNSTISGTVGIGNPDFSKCFDYKLAVNGKIIATELKIKLAPNWPDYVFNEKYKILSLAELQNYITRHKHLPGIPSEKDIEETEGIDIGNLNIQLLKKIEELTLYVLQLKESNDNLIDRISIIENNK